MSGWAAILISVPMTFLASWLGGLLHARLTASHLRVQALLSFVGGLMLGMALLHLLPHAVIEIGSVDRAVLMMLAGVIGIFLLMRFLHVHSHEPGVACLDGEAEDGHRHASQTHLADRPSRLRWVALLAGLGLHSVVDGVAIASAVKLSHGHGFIPGFAILLVVLLHKPIDAVSLTGTMAAGGESAGRRRAMNLAFALITPAATVAAYAGLSLAGEGAGYAMALAAGAFVCVALADLMPEVQFHSHHRVKLTAALLAGVGVAAAIGVLEGANHGHGHGHGQLIDPHAHHGH